MVTKHGKLTDKLAGEISYNLICIYIIGSYIILVKIIKKDLIIKYVRILYPFLGWFEIIQYDENKLIRVV